MKGLEFTNMELKKLNIIQSVIDHKRTEAEAAILLGIKERQVWGLVYKVKKIGPIGIKHGNKFNKPLRTVSIELRKRIIELKLSDDYCDTNFTHFKELLTSKFIDFIDNTTKKCIFLYI